MKEKDIKPIPKYIVDKIRKVDKKFCPEQKGLRFYSYLAIYKKELVKVTVAVKNYYKKWCVKQVSMHGVDSKDCLVKDLEYCGYVGMGYRVGWYAEGLSKYPNFYETTSWCNALDKYYNPYSYLVNKDLISKMPEFKYSAYELYKGKCIIKYLRLYREYPQAEYLLKLGLNNLVESTTILKLIGKDKNFCKWLVKNKDELSMNYFYTNVIIQAYKTNKSLKTLQWLSEQKKKLSSDQALRPIKGLFTKDLEQFFLYIQKQSTNVYSYLDYLNACNYLGLDMSLLKNRYPKDFSRWHNIRIDEYNSAKAQASEREKAMLYTKFESVASKYSKLEGLNKNGFVVILAKSPNDLVVEGEKLNHCVGSMNYDQKVIREESLIFFVRKTEHLEMPFVTVEYSLKTKKVLQCYGQNNSTPQDSVTHFINKIWLPYVGRTIKKIA